MLRFASKKEFFEAIHKDLCDPDALHLKFIQDAWFHLKFENKIGITRALEIGGGASRTLTRLARSGIECWNADKFEGEADGPLSNNPALNIQRRLNIKIKPVYIGEYSDDIPSDYFDLVYSISVLEHLDHERTVDCFKDAARILKKDGIIYNAVDVFLSDSPLKRTSDKIQSLNDAVNEAGFILIGKDEIGCEPIFRSSYATPADVYLARKWCFNKELQSLVENNQLVTLIMGHKLAN